MTGITGKAAMSREHFSAHLEEEILSGKLGEGDRLPSERSLAEKFGVSRPVVREVLRSLVERNLIEVLPGRGAYVRPPRMSDAAQPMGVLLQRNRATPRDLVEARKMLECKAARLAASRAASEDLRAMEWALERFDEAQDLIEKTRYDIAFHTGIIRAAHNPVIETMFGAITGLVAQLMMRSLGDPAVSRAGLPYHRQIYEAIFERKPEAARSAVVGHLLVAERLYGEDYDRSLTVLARRELERLFGPDAVSEHLLAATISTDDEGRPSGEDTDAQ